MPHKDPEVRAQYHREYAKAHKEELQAYRNKYRAEHAEEEKNWQNTYRSNTVNKRKDSVRYYRYGLDSTRYNEMLDLQGSCCAICDKPFIKTPHVDHCHATGKVRGLLCGPCNTGLGVYEKKHTLFKKYLDEHQ